MRELDEYFEGRRRRFDLRLDLDGISEFSRRVLDELALVPYGGVTSYGELAAAAGFPRAARAVGNVMNRNPIAIVLPCHRVIASDGTLGGYGGNLSRKRTLLALEGVSVDEIRSRSPQTSSNL
jgi:methylated-DNA-[protein]-cysteine S-methyltransferase